MFKVLLTITLSILSFCFKDESPGLSLAEKLSYEYTKDSDINISRVLLTYYYWSSYYSKCWKYDSYLIDDYTTVSG